MMAPRTYLVAVAVIGLGWLVWPAIYAGVRAVIAP